MSNPQDFFVGVSICAAQENLIVEGYIQHTVIINVSSSLNTFTVILLSYESDQGNGYDDLSYPLCSALLTASQHPARTLPHARNLTLL